MTETPSGGAGNIPMYGGAPVPPPVPGPPPPPAPPAPPAGTFGAPYGHGYPGHPAPMQNGLGLAGMICGICGAVLGFLLIGVVPAVLGIIFGAIGLGRAKRGVASNRGQALTGIITGIVGLLAFALVLSLAVAFRNESCGEKYQRGSHDYEVCVQNS